MKASFGHTDESRPKNISHSDNSLPYYNAVSATEFLPILTQLRTEHEKILASDIPKVSELRPLYFYYNDYSLKPRSIYAQVCNSWRWLIDNLDPDGVFKDLRSMVSVTQESDAVVIRWKSIRPPERFIKGGNFKDKTSWKTLVQEWITADTDDPITLKDLALSDDDISWLKTILDGSECIYKITGRDILKAVKKIETKP